MITNVFKLGNSNAVRLPQSIMKSLGLKTDDEVIMEVENDSIRIRKVNRRKNITELFDGYQGEYDKESFIDDGSVGKEMI